MLKYLEEGKSTLKELKEKNGVLIIGKTGVGKSTMI